MRRDKVITFDWLFLFSFLIGSFFFERHPKTFTVHLLLTTLKVIPNQMIKPMTAYSFIVWIIFLSFVNHFIDTFLICRIIHLALLRTPI